MQFNFVVGWHALNSGKEKAIAGFSKLETAKEYVMYVVCDYLSNGYFYIDTPEGRYIQGADRRTERLKWYAPSEKVYVYDLSKEDVIGLDEL